jgi:protein-S-isoprenylcysteine O-methyltransferase Ste14
MTCSPRASPPRYHVYLIFAAAFDLPTLSRQVFFDSPAVAGLGAAFCLAGLVMMAWSLISFEQSFRVGIDVEHPDRLITTGAFAISRNPIYVAFGCVLIGQFLIYPNWILLVYSAAGFWLLHRQVLREEVFLKEHYGGEFLAYRRKVRRYL